MTGVIKLEKRSVETVTRPSVSHQADLDSVTPLQQANYLMRIGNWEQAAIAYLRLFEAQEALRSIAGVNLSFLIRRAPSGSIDKEVLDHIQLILTSIGVGLTRNAGQTVRDNTLSVASSQIVPTDLARVLTNSLGIEQVYVVNLARRQDRYIRVLREMTKHGLHINRIDGVDALTSDEAIRVFDRFRSRPIEERRKSSEHISDDVMRQYKSQLTAGVFGYILSQAKVLHDAITNGYKRILVLDDDVFFHSNAIHRLDDICRCLPVNFKVLLLGASEYANRNSKSLHDSCFIGHPEIYHPIAGKTCGSFAMVYDRSVYEELADAIDEADGTFDNVALGSIYRRNPGKCIAVSPAICIPDVGDSDIRSNSRSQALHGARMNWEYDRYEEYRKPLILTVLVSSFDSLRHIESMRHEIGTNIFLNVFYLSGDGIRPVTPGHRFIPRDEEALAIRGTSQRDFRIMINDLRVPRSDTVMLWPIGRLLTEDAALSLYSRVMNVTNSTGNCDGKVDEVLFCHDAGVTPVHGRHSIIIPSYRDVDYVWPAVRSALSQDAQEFEVIVVNDNPENQQFSTRLRSIAMDWEKEIGTEGVANRLIAIDHRQNRQAAAARNTGLFWSSGEYISFLDDDDYYEPRRLTGIEPGFYGAGEDVGACYCGYSGNWNGERNMERFLEGDLGEYVLALQYSKHYMCTNTITFRRTCLQRLGGFNEGYARHQDLELMVRFFEKYRIMAVREFLVKNRPTPVPETFKADVKKLCQIKHQFLSDMRAIVRRKGSEFVGLVVDAHTNDIVKRDKDMPPSTVEIIRNFLVETLDLAR